MTSLKKQKIINRNTKQKGKNLIDKGKDALKVLGQTFVQLAERLKDKSSEIIYIHNKYQ